MRLRREPASATSVRWKVIAIALPAFLAGPVSFVLFPVGFDSVVRLWVNDVLVRIVIPMLCLYVLYRNDVRPRDYGMGRFLGRHTTNEFISITFLCTVGFLGYILVDAVVRAILDLAVPVKAGVGFSGTKLTVVAALYFSLAAAIFEEVLFRGVLAFALLGARTLIRVALYVLISSVFFSLAHVDSDLPGLVALAYTGVVASIAYVVVQNVWPLIIAHFCTDLFIYFWWLAKP